MEINVCKMLHILISPKRGKYEIYFPVQKESIIKVSVLQSIVKINMLNIFQ